MYGTFEMTCYESPYSMPLFSISLISIKAIFFGIFSFSDESPKYFLKFNSDCQDAFLVYSIIIVMCKNCQIWFEKKKTSESNLQCGLLISKCLYR